MSASLLAPGLDRPDRSTMTRRTFLAATAGAASLALTGCGGSPKPRQGRPVDKVTFLTAFGVNGRDGYAHVAKAKGFFAEAGIDVTIQAGKAGESNHLLLTSGQAQFAAVDASGAFIRYATKNDTGFQIVAAIQQSTLVSIIAMADRGIASPRDLAGKILGSATGAVPQTLFPAYARLVGIDPGTVRWTNTSPEQLPTLLIANKIDGAGLFLVARPGVEAAAHGRKTTVLPYSDVLPDLYGAALVTQKTTITSKPDLVRRFIRALLKGLDYAVTHPAEAGDILHEAEPTQDAGLAAAELELMRPYVLTANHPVGILDPTRGAQNLALLKSVGLIPTDTAAGLATDIINFDTVAAVTG
jgi:NitT/TauT family transport system substrate-binding protein